MLILALKHLLQTSHWPCSHGRLLSCDSIYHAKLWSCSHVTSAAVTRRRQEIPVPVAATSERQLGMVLRKGMRIAIFILRILGERSIEMQKDMCLCFIDYKKAFDRVKHEDFK